MDSPCTILIAASAGDHWSTVSERLVEEDGFRVLVARSDRRARAALGATDVDLVIAEDDGRGRGLGLLAELRLSHPDVVRVLALETDATVSPEAMLPAGVYQLVRKPPDREQVTLVVKRGLEVRELSRRRAYGLVPNGETLKQKVEDLEKRVVSETLARHRWNQSRAAGELGLSRVGLANKIRRYGLECAR